MNKKCLTWKWSRGSRDGVGIGSGPSYRYLRFTLKLVNEYEKKTKKKKKNRYLIQSLENYAYAKSWLVLHK